MQQHTMLYYCNVHQKNSAEVLYSTSSYLAIDYKHEQKYRTTNSTN